MILTTRREEAAWEQLIQMLKDQVRRMRRNTVDIHIDRIHTTVELQQLQGVCLPIITILPNRCFPL